MAFKFFFFNLKESLDDKFCYFFGPLPQLEYQFRLKMKGMSEDTKINDSCRKTIILT